MRYTGPKKKLCRREGMNLFGSEKYDLSKEKSKKGRGSFGKLSDFGLQLRKKQAARRMYSVSEKQFANYYKKASKQGGVTGDNMIQMLERRFDNVVLRANFARTIMQARQFVSHAHFLVNGKKTNIPSYQMCVGDVIQVRENKKGLGIYKSLVEEFGEFLKKNKKGVVSASKWFEVDIKALSIKITALPTQDDFDKSIDIQKIVEFYSK